MPRRRYDNLNGFMSMTLFRTQEWEGSFERIESIIAAPLPDSALNRESWWTNNPNVNYAKAWLSAGFHVASVDLENKTVQFKRGPAPE